MNGNIAMMFEDDDIELRREVARRLALDSKMYSEKEIMERFGITEEDLQKVGDVEIE